jgi:16S rRNA (uracil1498-N3)-methyltransferase
MSLDRFFAPAEKWQATEVLLTGDEAHHCSRVMRKRTGDKVEVFDGAGRCGRGIIAEDSGGVVRVELAETRKRAARLPAITLAVGIPKGKTMELIVQKAVELGVGAIQPLVTEHTVVRVDGAEAARKAGKWQRVALEACKQCGQNVLPEVAAPCSLQKWLSGRERGRPGLMASLAESAVSFREGIGRLPVDRAELDLLIGPEGDFSMPETKAALAAGFVPVTLGAIVLRVETAVLYGLSVLDYELRGRSSP